MSLVDRLLSRSRCYWSYLHWFDMRSTDIVVDDRIGIEDVAATDEIDDDW